MDPVLVKSAIIALAGLDAYGLLFGIGLALAAQKFAVKANPKVEEVLEVLAGASEAGAATPGAKPMLKRCE